MCKNITKLYVHWQILYGIERERGNKAGCDIKNNVKEKNVKPV